MIHSYFTADPLAQYYNLDGLADIVLTCDVDSSVHTGMGIRTFYTMLLEELRQGKVRSHFLRSLAWLQAWTQQKTPVMTELTLQGVSSGMSGRGGR